MLRSAAFSIALTATVLGADAPDFAREVRPILSGYCFKCHGPDEQARKSGLRLDSREAAMKEARSGAHAIVPGRTADSELVARILSEDPEEVMPPPSMKRPLSAGQKDVLRRWVESGADYRPHWAFVAPRKAELPNIEHPIDRFVGARLAKEGLAFSSEADALTLVRRLYLDLIGLPPTPEEADAFAKDRSPGAYDRLVDHLLASPRYGERWARRWLDLARYADTNGYEKDRPRNIWPWRDWVIRALNEDMPFDQFTIEQLAGDLLPGATQEQLVATGFHRNTMLNEEGGIDPLEFRYHAMADRVGTTATTWLGLTMMCAQCHTHKYDPITHREYYQTMAFLNNADEPDLDLGAETPQQREQRETEAARLLAKLADHWPVEAGNWETPRHAKVSTEQPDKTRVLDDGSVLFTAPGPEKNTATFVIETTAPRIDRLRLEAKAHASLPSKGPGRTKHGNFVLSEIEIVAEPRGGGAAQPVKIKSATADTEQNNFAIGSAFDGKLDTGWAVDAAGKTLNETKSATFEFEQPVAFAGGARFTVKLVQAHGTHHTIGNARLSLGLPEEKGGDIAARREAAIEREFDAWLAKQRAAAVAWSTMKPLSATSNLPHLAVQPDASIFVSGDISKSDTYEVKFAAPAGTTALRIEALPDERLPEGGPGLTYYEGPKGDFFMGEFQAFAGGAPVKIARASESYAKNGMGGNPANAALAIDGDLQTGWSCAGRYGERHVAVFVLAEPLRAADGITVKMTFGRHYAASLGRFRFSATNDTRGGEANDLPEESAALLAKPALTGAERAKLREVFLLTVPQLAKEAEKIRSLRKPRGGQTTLVMRERPAENPRPTFIQHRGEFLQPKDRVTPAVLSVLNPLPAGAKGTRLDFARWLVARENPLTARVTVNRQWAAFFGRGLVRTTEDFGFQGEMPTHPELLDWLAVEFMEQGWSLKKLHRLIVTSATYRQSSRVTPELLARDPQNKLLARAPRVRIEAEIVRDSVLRASGLLSEKMHGPPVRPPQPASVTEAAYGGQGWEPSTGEDRYRRSLYTFQKRTAPFAMLGTFDAPSGEACVARRDVSNTPLQSLTLLNDAMFIEMARALGALAAKHPGDDTEKVALLFRRLLTRPPTAQESETLLAFFRAQRDRLTDDADARAWTATARAVMNLDEAVTRN